MSTPFMDQELVPADPRELAIARSRRLSRALKEAAGRARTGNANRTAVIPAVPTVLRTPLAWFFEHKPASSAVLYRFEIPVRLTLLVFAIIPSLVAVLYFGLIASGQYVSEMKFSVRGGERGMEAMGGSLMASFTQAQDTLVIENYLTSRALVEELEKRVGLREMFSRSGVDWLSRFDPDDPVEDLVWYWGHKVSAAIQMPSGIMTVSVRAFTPEDSQRIAQAVLELSEALVNEMSARSRRDMVAQSEAELQRAEARLKNARIAQQALRNQEGMLDPEKQAEGIDRLLNELRTERIRLEGDLAAAQPSLSEQAPQLQVLRARIRATAEQIAGLERKLTSEGEGNEPTLARSMTRFEAAELEYQVAERQYTSAASALERARANAERQAVYVSTFVQPVLPEEALYPRRFWYSFGSILGFFLLWGAGIGIARLVRDNMA